MSFQLDDKIGFFLPLEIDLEKSVANGNGTSERRIRGYASTSARDRQDDEIVQKGLDISEFLDSGWFNYDHDNTKILGYPDKSATRIDSHGFWVEGNLLKGLPLADSIWDLAIALKKSNAPRKMGFSVEGKVLERSKLGRIIKAKVYNVAITPNPVNAEATWEALVKSMSEDVPVIGGKADYTVPMEEDSGTGVLKRESLESALKNLSYLVDDCPEAQQKLKELKEIYSVKPLSKSEAVLYLQLTRGISRNDAIEVVNKIYC